MSFKQTYSDGTLVPKKYYCNVYWISNEKDIIIKDFNTNPDELIGHHINCKFAQNYKNISLALLTNCYIGHGDGRMGIKEQVIPPIEKCTCKSDTIFTKIKNLLQQQRKSLVI